MENAASQASPWPGRLRLLAAGLTLAAVILMARALPLDQIGNLLGGWIEGLGFLGPVIFALIYGVWATAFLPGAALTLVGGAIFGLGLGLAAVWFGAMIAMALSFLIARYFARERVEAMARSNPKFGAIDGAIAEGGWKIVALLRLSPAVPFNLQNYLYGLTPIGFWTCWLTSAVAILPGTFLYVYLGHLAGQGLQAAGGAGGDKPLAQWILLGVGLLATVAVTVYVTKLARKQLDKQTSVEPAAAEPTTTRRTSPASSFAMLAIAGVLFASALYAYSARSSLQSLFGPPAAQLNESYQRITGGPDLDHAPFNELLAEHVNERGLVDYAGLLEKQSELDAYIASIARAPVGQMGRDQRLALLINAYNAFTLRLILDHWPTDSIRSIPGGERWKAERWDIGGEIYSLDQIEHKQIRPHFAEPRIHFALVCAAMGCPRLRNEAYEPERLEAQLEDQAVYTHSNDTWFSFDPAANKAKLTPLYNWYGGDFKQAAGSPLAYAARYSPELKKALDAGQDVRIDWLDYDWSLNVQGGRQ